MPSFERVLKSGGSLAPAPATQAARPGERRVVGSESGSSRSTQPRPAPAYASAPGPGTDGAEAAVELTIEIQRVVREAERRGYEAGRARGEAELMAAVAACGSIAAALEDAAPRQAPVIAAIVAELAVAVASRILNAEVSVDPALLLGALERAMDGVNGSPDVRVILHPAAVELVRDAWFATHGTAFSGKRWTFESDPTLPIGGCVVRHDHGFVDAGLEAQLAEVSAAMDKVVPLVGRGQDAAA